jgi:hypothetical protein
MKHGGNQGGRPRKIDRSTVALTTVRVQLSVLQLLNQLKKKHGFADLNSVIKYYLPPSIDDNKPIFLTAKQVYQLTYSNKQLNKMIKKSAAALVRKRN